MTSFMKNLRLFSPVVLRLSIALVFLWFGINQIADPNQWVAYVPDSVVNFSGLAVTTIVFLNAIFEIILGSALLLGFFTRWTAALLALHIIDIFIIVGMNATGVRDFGIAAATVTIWLNGSDWLSLDRFMRQESFAAPAVALPNNNQTKNEL